MFEGKLPGYLHLGDVGDSARVFINGKDAGTVIAPPYVFDVSGMAREGRNEVRIHVRPSGVRQRQTKKKNLGDLVSPSAYPCLPPSGILGPAVWI